MSLHVLVKAVCMLWCVWWGKLSSDGHHTNIHTGLCSAASRGVLCFFQLLVSVWWTHLTMWLRSYRADRARPQMTETDSWPLGCTQAGKPLNLYYYNGAVSENILVWPSMLNRCFPTVGKKCFWKPPPGLTCCACWDAFLTVRCIHSNKNKNPNEQNVSPCLCFCCLTMSLWYLQRELLIDFKKN